MIDQTLPTPSFLLARLRETSPLVQCITNYVAMNFAANVLSAAGASPAMVHAPEESGEFAANAGALTVNIGTLSTDWIRGMKVAAQSAHQGSIPWVLDPVAHFATAFRRQTVADLLALRPTIVRGNASEIMALSGQQSAGQGVDSGDSVEKAEASAHAVAQKQSAIVAVTGEKDFVTDGMRAVRIAGGSSLMPKITTMGCALTGLVGAFTAIAPETPFDATVSALANFAVAGTHAARDAKGPGSFTAHFVDALYALNVDTLKSARIEYL